jgi:hypothetical protein
VDANPVSAGMSSSSKRTTLLASVGWALLCADSCATWHAAIVNNSALLLGQLKSKI